MDDFSLFFGIYEKYWTFVGYEIVELYWYISQYAGRLDMKFVQPKRKSTHLLYFSNQRDKRFPMIYSLLGVLVHGRKKPYSENLIQKYQNFLKFSMFFDIRH